jgi:hypothetical protein
MTKKKKTLKIETISEFKIFQYDYNSFTDALETNIDRKYLEQIYYNFPVFINEDYSMWTDGNRFLLSLLQDGEFPSYTKLSTKASQLLLYKQFCDKMQLDYINFNNPLESPLQQYKKYLQNLILQLEEPISKNVAENRMKTVIDFYNWLIDYEGVMFPFPLWIKKELNKSIKNKKSKLYSLKSIVVYDLTKFKDRHSIDTVTYDEDLIIDDGKLYPLEKDEQTFLINALKNIGNIEMYYSFLLSLYTGARMQTIFTLRIGNFQQEILPSQNYMYIHAGASTNVDSKFEKPYTIRVPSWLYEKIQIYINSKRANNRYKKASNKLSNQLDQYIFITQKNSVYYAHRNDLYYKKKKTKPRGNGVTQFIQNTLKNYYEIHGQDFNNFHFHNLRASFGKNYIDDNYHRVTNGSISEDELLDELKMLLNHEDRETTKQYLKKRRKDYRKKLQYQKAYEEQLERISHYV